MQKIDSWVSRVSGWWALVGVLFVAGPAVVAYLRGASDTERVIIGVGLALIVLVALAQLRKRAFVSATGALRDANGRVTRFLRGRAALAPGDSPASTDEDWLRKHHGDDQYQRETVSEYYALHQKAVLDALDLPGVREHIKTEDRRFAQQPRTVEDIWTIAELLSAANRDIQGNRDPAYDRPYAYEDRRSDA